MASEEWGPWIEHDGRGCPCRNVTILAKYNDPKEGVMEAFVMNGNPEAWDWSYKPELFYKIVRYRIRKPRALLQLIDMVENLPAPAKEPA